jgi:hypothetical protein
MRKQSCVCGHSKLAHGVSDRALRKKKVFPCVRLLCECRNFKPANGNGQQSESKTLR